MQLTFLGATREVTGSCYLLKTRDKNFLVDCGLIQGKGEERNYQPFSFSPGDIDFILLTHAHLDHSGRIPLLCRHGFRGKIYATPPTIELTHLLWLDTAKIMREEAERINRKNVRQGKPPIQPLFGEEEVEEAMNLFEPVSYDELVSEGEVEFVFRDSAHILGGAALEIWGEGSKVVFSGDLGQFYSVMEGSPPVIERADFVVIESTYGNRRHRSLEDTRREFSEAIEGALSKGGKVLIPSFVVDRAQRIIYELFLLQERLDGKYPVFFDSPMGVKVTDIYRQYRNLLAGEIQKLNLEKIDPFSLPGLHYVTTPAESKAINNINQAIVIAGSGMCTGGRIIHHLKHNLYKENTALIFVGFQAQGTLGRALVEGAKRVRIMGEEIVVRAKIYTINGFSVHADQEDLFRWVEYFQGNPTFLVTHGEEAIAESFAQFLGERGKEALVPHLGDTMDLAKKKVFSAPSLPPEENILEQLESKVSSLESIYPALGEEEKILLRSALILLEEVERRKEESLI
ncbi:MAG TPA: MBL fold metallo-hydrolase [Candidatus Atribacteria bacterium]|uniref:MBL fold metallo-hydrolase n=1 Tax=Candidatus Sordicultor fermentans TaxID=1953203 RepID=UPI00168F8BF4|nr:MBL fold metallo-hydrolase [Atribacterota bacterium]NLY06091.1 MBL fold metallo-hydrolase [Candidatus Atribacteria bacterium]MDI9607562.1 MBL fold metallo-hydrolase [Atribacterota bacterium]HOA99714.1 MBL fold metallo-hydrolase [Candidatus Atribacteria bacterium]HOQ50489.1 MBL fold metallo-hydrolase [Candidatus Atribacteria bacterium]